MLSKGYGAEEAKAAFARAEELAVAADNPAERFVAYYGLWTGRISRGEVALAREIAEKFRREAENEGRMTEAGVARRILGFTCLWQGDFAEAHAHLDRALKIYDPERDREARFRFGHDSEVGAMAYLAQANWVLGEIGRARELIEVAVLRAVECGHVPTQINTYRIKAVFDILRGDAGAARRTAETVVDLSREHGLALFLTLGELLAGLASAELDDLATAATKFRQVFAAYTDSGNKFWVPFFHSRLAEIEAQGQGGDGALARIDEALALADETGEHWTDSFLHRIRGEILLKRDGANTAPVEEAFLTAIAIARRQKARSFELRAAMSMARLWRDQGKREQARDLLAPVYGWFTEGFDTLDLKEAKALLDELHA